MIQHSLFGAFSLIPTSKVPMQDDNTSMKPHQTPSASFSLFFTIYAPRAVTRFDLLHEHSPREYGSTSQGTTSHCPRQAADIRQHICCEYIYLLMETARQKTDTGESRSHRSLLEIFKTQPY